MTTFISRFDTSGTGPRLAVKDLIDIEGEPTTAGCKAVAENAKPAERDALCMVGSRAAGARIVGKTNLHELALGVTGRNPWYGTPVNPLDPGRVPGGSSSGSAVAVATEEADVAFGSDTGGSVRIPSACCGTVGLKTTWGRVPLQGVYPLSPSFDTVGPMARDVAGAIAGMALLEPGFAVARDDRLGDPKGLCVGRLLVDSDPEIDAAIDSALKKTPWAVAEIPEPEWSSVTASAGVLLVAEAYRTDHLLLEARPDGIGEDVRARLTLGRDMGTEDALRAARQSQERWRSRLIDLFTRFDLLATPTLAIFAPTFDDADDLRVARHTLPVNLAGVPALSMPVRARGTLHGPLPASLQLIGPHNSEELLLAAGLVLEACA